MNLRTVSEVVWLFLVLSSVQGSDVYRHPKCRESCTIESEFELPLPPHPEDDGSNQAIKWGTVLLNQIKDNIKDLSPPGIARILAVFSSCLHDTVAIASLSMQPAYAPDTGLSDLSLDSAVDGASYEALSSMFGEFPSIEKVNEFLAEEFRDLVTMGGTSSATAPQSSEDYIDSITGFPDGSSANFAVSPSAELTGFQIGTGFDTDSDEFSFLMGKKICSDVIAAFTADGFNALGQAGSGIKSEFPGFVPINLPQGTPGITNCESEMISYDAWQPLCVPVEFGSKICRVQEFLAPYGDKMMTFAVDGIESFNLSGPPLYEDAGGIEWKRQAREVAMFSQNLTDVTKIIAEFWADGPDSTAPPGHWYRIAMEAAMRQNLDLQETSKVLFVVGNALNDAGVAAWDAKISFNSIRPLQMIQCGFSDETLDAWIGPYQGVGDVPGAVWQPYQAATFVTPKFSGYVSGHSTFSAAAAGALRNYFGPEYIAPKCKRVREGESVFEGIIKEGEPGYVAGLTDIPNEGPRTKGYSPSADMILCWDTWEEAAEEAGISRLMGGIHIIADHTDGERMGYEIADMVYDKSKGLWS